MDKRVAYIGCESSLLLLNYCIEGIKYEEQKNLLLFAWSVDVRLTRYYLHGAWMFG
jgi:hypothetical protein